MTTQHFDYRLSTSEWLAGGYDLENRTFSEVASMVVTWWIVAVLSSDSYYNVADARGPVN